jgi:cation transporter-like permease
LRIALQSSRRFEFSAKNEIRETYLVHSICELENKEVTVMPLVQFVMVLIVVGVLLWLVNNFIPMQGSIKSILNAVVVIGVVLWILNVFGLFHSFAHIRVGS